MILSAGQHGRPKAATTKVVNKKSKDMKHQRIRLEKRLGKY